MAQDLQIFTLRGGLDKDSSLNDVDTNDYIDARDIDFFTKDGNEMNEGRPTQSTVEVYDIPAATAANRVFQIEYTPNGGGYYISLKYGATSVLQSSFVAVDANAFSTAINGIIGLVTSVSLLGNTVTVTMDAGYPDAVIDFGLYTDDGDISLQPVLLTQDYCEPTELRQIASVQYNNLLFICSKGISYPTSELGVVQHILDGQGAETITYTRLARGRGFNFPTGELISLRTELFNENDVSIYYTDYTNTPRVIYCPLAIVQDGILEQNGGRYNLGVIDEQTRLQLINNGITVTLKEQVNDGGQLLTGGKRYAVRSLVNNTATEWSDLSNLVPVFIPSTNAAPFRIKGDKAGERSTKKNILRVRGANPSIFDFIELAVIDYGDSGQVAAQIVGRFAVTGDIMDIEHIGSEVGQDLDATTLINNQRPVIEKAKLLEIKDNRMNLANVKISASDDLRTIFANTTQSTTREALDWTGKLTSFPTPEPQVDVNESKSDTAVDAFADLIFDNTSSGSYNTTTGTYTIPSDNAYIFNIKNVPLIYSGGNISYQLLIYVNTYSSTIPFASSNVIDDFIEIPTPPANVTLTINQIATPPISLKSGDLVTFKIIAFTADGAFSIGNSTSASMQISISSTDAFYTSDLEFGEYQSPQNVHDKGGYMLDEVYCFAARVHYKNGFVSKPYPIGSGQYVMGSGQNLSSLTTPVTTFSSGVGAGVYAYALELDGIDITSIRNEIVGISICRADVTNPRVKSAGAFIRAEDVAVIGDGTSYFAGFHASRFNVDQFFTGAPAAIDPAKSYLKRYGAFLSPDTLFNLTDINLGDNELWVYGTNSYKATKPYSYINDVLGNGYIGYMTEYCVDTTSQEAVSADPVTKMDIEDIAKVDFNSTSTTLFEKTGTIRGLSLYNESSFSFKTATFRGYAMVLEDGIFPSIPQDYGIHYAKVVSKTIPTYNLDDIEYKPIHYIKVDNSTPNIINNVVVWGGDTYTQKTFVKLNYGSANVDGNGFRTGAVSFYSQNRVNSQMRHVDPTINDYPMFPYNGRIVDWLNNASGREETFVYNLGYIAPNSINQERRYNPIFENSGNKTASIYYTEQKPIGAVQDLYREILPLNVKDLDPKDGAIVGFYDMKDVIVSIQRDAVMVLPYQSDTLVGTTTGDVVVGSGAVYSRRGNKISTIGTELATAVYLAKNSAGNPTLYWYSTPYKKFVRYGNDGIKIWSDIAKMRTYFLRETKHIKNEYDIHMGFDSDKSNLFITSKRFGFKDTPLTWTLVFNESRNRFTHFYTLTPDRWFVYDNRVYVPNIKGDYGKCFLNEGGTSILQFLNDNTGFIQGELIIEPVLNKNPDIDKRILATSITLGGTEYDNNPPFLKTIGESNFESENAPNEWEYIRGCYRTSNNCDYNDDPIMGNAIPIRITNQLMIRIENIIARFYVKFRTPFR